MTLRTLRVVAGICAVLMVILVFQAVQADVPDTGADEFNHALARNGAVAGASGWLGTNPPSLAIDGAASTYWKNSQYTGSIQVTFPEKAYINEVHAHFLSVKYPSLSLYFDTNGNGQYEAVEKVWSTTTNSVLDVKIITSTYYTLGMRLTIDAKVGKNLAQIAEFEAYLRYDTDGDGLTNQQEMSTVYFQDMKPAGFPQSIPDDGSNATSSTVSLAQWAGIGFQALANFTVDHAARTALTASIGYWTGTAWADTYIWDPGGRVTGQATANVSALNVTQGSSKPSAVLGLRTSEWTLGQTISGSSTTVVVNLTGSKALATPAENMSGIIRPELPASSFFTFLSWRLVITDWVTGSSGSLTSFILRFEAHSDPQKADTDADGIQDGVEVYTWHTLPAAADTDLDGLSDGYEIASHTLTITGDGRTTIAFVTTSIAWAGDLGPATTMILGGVDGTQEDLFVLTFGIARDSGYIVSVTDRIGSAWTRVVNASNPGKVRIEMWVAFYVGPTGPITIKVSTSNMKVAFVQDQYSGIGSVASAGTAIGTGTSPSATTTSQSNAWVIGGVSAQGTLLPDAANGTLRGSKATTGSAGSSNVGTAASDILVISPGMQTLRYSLGSSEPWVAAAVELDPAPKQDSVVILPAFTTDPTKWDTDGDGLSDGQERGVVSMGQTKTIGEVGLVRNVVGTSTTVYLRNHYTSPVVVAEPTTLHGPSFDHVRILGITDHTFQLKVETWSSSDPSAAEDVSYLVVEAGNFILPDGSHVEAGTASVGISAVTLPFRAAFSTVPLVLVQTQTVNDGRPVVAKRTAAVDSSSFGAYLNANSSAHGSETVGYVAITPQANPLSLATWTRTDMSATSPEVTWSFPVNFTSPPLILAWMATELAGGDHNLGLRLVSVSNASATLFREITGTGAADRIDAFAFSGPQDLSARMTTDPLRVDTDGDSLADGTEVNTYGSNPTSRDTDHDGILDNVEVTPRTIQMAVNGVQQSIPFTTSPTSDDTDADGLKDLDELLGVLDHRDLYLDMSALVDSSHLQDLSGNGNLVSIAGATCGPAVAGWIGDACSFAGTASHLEVPDAPVLDFTESFTLAAWVKPTSTPQSEGALMAKGIAGSEAFLLDVHDNAFRVLVRSGASAWTAASSTLIVSGVWYFVAAVYDGPSGTLTLYVNGTTVGTATGVAATINTNAHALSLGSQESTPTSGYDRGFRGVIDEAQAADRALSAQEVSADCNVTSVPASLIASYDMEARTPSGNLFDFTGSGHDGITTGTTVIEGRTGFARFLHGGTDGLTVNNSVGVSFYGGVFLSVYVDVSTYPASDTSLVARPGSFYLNLTSDGRVVWTVGGSSALASSASIGLNRWVRIAAIADRNVRSLFVDAAQVATGSGAAPLNATANVIVGYAPGGSHLVGGLDEFLLLNRVPASTNTVLDLGVRGIVVNPKATDTDGDGLADGQELVVQAFKTAKRYPLPEDSSATARRLDMTGFRYP
ncbi:MAG TPA: LamG-like jellyroll fold domain-containing protein, partial [Thermoplasmata archaeon]|nr:LamG-like jellyroll fold domain-containing protein [Thermoplasmata archaeon]